MSMTTIEEWSVYILRCGDDSLYTGIAKDVDKRLQVHLLGKGAKYTRARGPLFLVYQEHDHTRSSALKREATIKRLPRSEKIKLCDRYNPNSEAATR